MLRNLLRVAACISIGFLSGAFARGDVIDNLGSGGNTANPFSTLVSQRAVGFTIGNTPVIIGTGDAVTLRLGFTSLLDFEAGNLKPATQLSLGIFQSTGILNDPNLGMSLVTTLTSQSPNIGYVPAGPNLYDFFVPQDTSLAAGESYFLVLQDLSPTGLAQDAPRLIWFGANAAADGSLSEGSATSYQQTAGVWTQLGSSNLAVGIQGEGVPEPTTCGLFAVMGVAGAFAEYKRRRKGKVEKVAA